MLINFGYMLVVFIIALAIGGIGYKVKKVLGIFLFGFTLIAGYVMWTSYFENVLAKRFGGVMTVSTPEGEYHMLSTWKDDNLWIQSYDPQTGICHFREHSRIGMLEGEVRIKDCAPWYIGTLSRD